MAKFKFRLQSFLNLKEKMEEQKKLEYGKALQKLEEEKRVKRSLEENMQSSIEIYRSKISKKINPLELGNFNNYIEVLKKDLEAQEKKIVDAQFVVDRTQEDLAAAVREKKMLEKLREKDLTQFNKEQLMAEQKFADEIVSYQYNKRKKDLEG